MPGLRLVVGLGNPGPEYLATRHNAGFWWAERLARALKTPLRTEAKFHGLAGRSPDGVWLLLPQTYMNLSGRAVAALARFHKIGPEDILVAHDELDLPPGDVRLKKGGGHAGHNGLRGIIAQLGSGDFYRLRLGIGHPGDRAAVVNYVLRPPRAEEQSAIDAAIDRSLEVMPLLWAGDVSRAMHVLHTRPSPPTPPRDEPHP